VPPYSVAQQKCPECNEYFDFKKGKKYCSDKCRKRVAGRKYDMKRLPVQEEKGALFRERNPEYDKLRMRERRIKYREKYGYNTGYHPSYVLNTFSPIHEKSEAGIVASDWHIPFHHMGYVNWLLDVQQEYGVPDLFIPGDFVDMESYSMWPDIGRKESFKNEKQMAGEMLSVLGERFENIYVCMGNHEFRIMRQNNGQLDMQELFDMFHAPSNVHVTNDTFLRVDFGEDEWYMCHPQNFRKNRLSVAEEMAEIHHMNILTAHGHQWAQGYDKSGRFECLAGGGIFDIRMIKYARRSSCHAKQQAGFYLIDESGSIPFTLGVEQDGI